MVPNNVRASIAVTLAAVLLMAAVAAAQVAEFDFYPEFRRWLAANAAATPRTAPIEERLQQYREKLRSEGIAATEIDRRIALIQTRRQELENDFWNRFFTVETPSFNTHPDAFLVSVAEKRKPGKALDVGMGRGATPYTSQNSNGM